MGALLLILIACATLGLSIASAHKQSVANARTVDRSGRAAVANRILLLGIALIWMIAQTSQTLAHDSWINRGGYRNPAGEWCTMLNQRCFAWRRARVVVFTPFLAGENAAKL